MSEIVNAKETVKEDVVHEPTHYKHGLYEVIDEMLIVFGAQKTYDFCILNAWKYRARAFYKGKAVEDLQKADNYLHMARLIAAKNHFDVRPVGLIKSDEDGLESV